MIRQAKSGHPILIVRGCATASAVDPIGEGERWAKAQEPELLSRGTDGPIVVIGAGSGYHIGALAKRWSTPIVVLDSDPDLKAQRDWFNRDLNSNVRFEFVVASDINQFFANPTIGQLLKDRFLLLRHKPSFIRNSKEMESIALWLTGRSRESIKFHLRARQEHDLELSHGLELGRIPDSSLLSIKDLSRAWALKAEPTGDRRIFRVLEELVR